MAFIKKIGIDLGTTNTLVYVPKRGVVINEPSVVAISIIDKKILYQIIYCSDFTLCY